MPGAFLWAGFPLYNLSVTPDGVPPLLVGEALAFRSVSSSIGNFSAPPEAPLPGELSSECETERLDEGTAYRCAAALSCRACPLRHACGVPPLPKGEALAGRATFYWTPEARYGVKGRALLQRAAASGQRTLSSCRWPGQQGTTVHETDKLCSSRGNLTDMPRPPLGRGGGTASAVTERFSLSRNLPAFSSTLPYPSDTPDASNASGRAGRTRSGQSGRRGAAPRPYLPASG